MLAGANPSGVFTVSINPSASTLTHQPPTSSVQSFQGASAIILPQPVQQVSQGTIPHLVPGGQIVNLTPVRAAGSVTTEQVTNNQTPPAPKVHSCSFCHKTFSSRYNVTRHEKICKLNTSILPQAVPVAEPKFFCETCQKAFQSRDSLNRHLKKCKAVILPQKSVALADIGWTSRKVHLCKFCGKEFSTKWNVIRHEKLFHNPDDPIVVPQSVANGMATSVTVISPPGKPERFCRFCGNYFSSKYNAIRHEKICTRIQSYTTKTSNSKPAEQPPQQLPPTQAIQIQTQPQPSPVGKPLQITSITGGAQTIIIPDPSQQAVAHQQQAEQQQQQNTQEQQPSIQQHIVQQQQVQPAPQLQAANIQTNQTQQLLPQQAMLLIEQPTTPFHVCKFCNKQLSTRCEPGSHNLLANVPTVATLTGQPMQINTSGAQIAGLVAPVMASLPQVTLVQPQISTLQGQQLIQHQLTSQQQQQTAQLQHDNKDRIQAPTSQQPPAQQEPQTNPQNEQQIPQQHIRLPQQHQQLQIQTTVQHNGPTPPAPGGIERPHSCKFCEKHFASKWYLDQHEKIHTGEADMCKVCGKFFVTRWHLDKHMRVHLTEASPAKKPKKDVIAVPSSGEVIPVDAIHATTIDFPHIIIGPGPASSATNIAPNSAQTFTVSSSDLVQQAVLPAIEQPAAVNQPASSAPTPTQVTSSRADEEHSTIDKSQIASTLSITYA